MKAMSERLRGRSRSRSLRPITEHIGEIPSFINIGTDGFVDIICLIRSGSMEL
jgi:hypothetical protein